MSKGKRLYINVWDKCNLNCRHCFNEGGKGKGEVLSYSEIARLIYDAQEFMGIREVQMTGGEPTQRPDIFPLILELHHKGLNILLQTNGVFGSDIRDEILKFPSERLSLIISLDGIRTNDYFRGRKATEKTIENIKILSQKFTIRINTLLSSKITWDEIEQIVVLAEEYNLSLAFNPICPSGRADFSLLMPPAKLFEWMYKLEDLRHRGIEIRKCFDVMNGQLLEYEDCPVRKGTAVHIAADGEVHPCGFLNNPECYAGSVRQHSLTSLLNRIPKNSRTLATRCIRCDFYAREYCHGGCPARIFALYKRFDKVDIYCMAEYLKK